MNLTIKRKYSIYIFYLIIPIISINANTFFFDNFNWVKEKKYGDIQLYSYKNDNDNITSYKAETIIKNLDVKVIYDALLDFRNYRSIFPRTIIFEKREQLNNNKYLIYSIIDFSPLMNRDYFIELEYYNEKLPDDNNIYVLRWIPFKDADKFNDSNNIKRVKNIYGRWTIKELENGNLYISVEYHNDFEINVPLKILESFEKKSTAKAIDNLINYVLNKK